MEITMSSQKFTTVNILYSQSVYLLFILCNHLIRNFKKLNVGIKT